jgi:tetratricopeptide (TPR) repeat protein
MNDRPWEVTSIAELQRDDGWAPIRRDLSVRSFGINSFSAREAGGHVIPDHDEEPSGHEELYLVVAGRAGFTVDGEETDAPAGTIVVVRDPALRRGAVAREPGTTVLAVGGRPGEAYRPRAWETNADVVALLNQGRNAEAKQLLLDALDRYDDRAVLLYNLACAEALLGETDAAVGHLEQSIAERPSFAELAREDTDLDAIRDDPRVARLLQS